MANIPYGNEGLPSGISTEEFSYVELFANSTPLPVTRAYQGEGDVAIAPFTVVGLAGDGYLVAALRDKTVQAIGITLAGIEASGNVQGVGVYVQGNFNINALVFDASYDTTAKKLAAFDDAPTPTNIVLADIAA